MQKVTIIVGDGSAHATVLADVSRGGITTGNNSLGSPNLTHYTVTVAGQLVPGTWNDDARNNIMVEVPQSHPLAAAVRKLATLQECRRNSRIGAPKDWRSDDRAQAEQQLREELAEARREVEEDDLAAQLASLAAHQTV